MKQRGGLLQNADTTDIEDFNEETKFEGKFDEKEDKKSLINFIKWIKFISLGQYRTPLYFKNSDSYSSLFGGIMTILVIVSLLTYTVLILIPII